MCREFATSSACSHTREAAGIRAAQVNIKDHVMAGAVAVSAERVGKSRDDFTRVRNT